MKKATHLQFDADETLLCPACAAPQQGVAGDFPHPGRIGPSSRFLDRCTHCAVPFVAQRLDSSQVKVEVA